MMDELQELPGVLRAATDALRDPVQPSAAFRGRVLGAIATPTRWSLRPWQALAAAAVCMLLGAGTTAVVLRARADGPPTSGTAPAGAVPVRFRLVAPGAASVAVVGDFNQWNPASLPLARTADGSAWELVVRLPPGRYAYSFLVDGALALDPAAPRTGGDDFGTPNSVLMVRGS